MRNLIKTITAVIISSMLLTAITHSQLVLASSFPTKAKSTHLATAHQSVPVITNQNPDALRDFFDAYFNEKMAEFLVPGAAVIVVQGSEIMFIEGYGYADQDQQILVDPHNTLFRVGSVSKTFTATAIMQLVEDGMIDLNQNINEYLNDFQIDQFDGSPITSRHLLTHTAGFEIREIGLTYTNPADAIPLEEFISKKLPTQVRPPGLISSYSNFGYGLLGLIVENVSGKPFEVYVNEHIYTPLGMNKSSFSITEALNKTIEEHPEASLATGYLREGDSVLAIPIDYHHIPPAGTMLSSAKDMGQFIISQLNQGRLDQVEILNPESATTMQSQQYTNHPELPGYGFGYYERFQNGLRIIEHGGNYYGFMANMILIPEKDLGFFYVYNQNNRELWHDLPGTFLDHFFPWDEGVGTLEPPRNRPDYYDSLAGSYRTTRHSQTTIEKIQQLGQERRISFTDDHVLLLHPPAGDDSAPTRWIETSPFLFQEENGEQLLAFEVDQNGSQTPYLLLGYTGHTGAFSQLAWYETTAFHLFLIGLSAIVSISIGILWPLVRLFRRLLKKSSPGLHWVWQITIALGFLNAVFLFGFLGTAANVTQAGFPPSLTVIRVLGMLAAIITILSAVPSVLTWFKQKAWRWSIIQSLTHTLIVVVWLGFFWSMSYWRVIF